MCIADRVECVENFNPKLSVVDQSQSERQVVPLAHLVLCSEYLAGSRRCADSLIKLDV